MTGKFNLSAFRQSWIQEEIDEHCIVFMEQFGVHLCDKKNRDDRFPGYNAVTTSQMRNIFSEVKRIEVKVTSDEQWSKEHTNVLLLRPKIAYNTARVLSSKRDSKMVDLREVLEKALLAVGNREDFSRFTQFLEGVIAYHKVYGGKD